jgi:MFS family permease
MLAGLQVLACLCGVITVHLMRRQHDPAPSPAGSTITLRDALEPFRDPRVRGLVVYHLAWNGAVGLAGSFFALYMVRDLKMGFSLLAVHGASIAALRMLVAPVWGVLIDRLGARPVLAACSFFIASIPFFWFLPTEHRLWPLALDALLAGVFWSGHALAAFALPLSVTGRRERPFYVAGLAAASGLAFAAATATGGLLASSLPSTLTLVGFEVRNLQILFLLSGILRFAAAFLCLRIHEPAARGVGALWSAIIGPLMRTPAPVPVPRKRHGSSV